MSTVFSELLLSLFRKLFLLCIVFICVYLFSVSLLVILDMPLLLLRPGILKILSLGISVMIIRSAR